MLSNRIRLDASLASRQLALDWMVEPLRRRRQQPVTAGLLEAAQERLEVGEVVREARTKEVEVPNSTTKQLKLFHFLRWAAAQPEPLLRIAHAHLPESPCL